MSDGGARDADLAVLLLGSGGREHAMATALLRSDLLGQLYIVSRAHQDGLQLDNDSNWEEVVADWHPMIAKAILEAWSMSTEISEAAERQGTEIDDQLGTESPLTRLLIAARSHYELECEKTAGQDPEKITRMEEALATVTLDGRPFPELVAACADDIEEMRLALA